MNGNIVLSIETGVSFGSLSILKDGREVDGWIGKQKVASSVDLLSNITDLLSRNNVSKTEIKRIAVSIGPGSFTGVRVGIATAIGLSKALRCECSGVSVLEAMTLKSQTPGMLAAFAIGENEICWQAFETDESNRIEPRSSPKIDLIKDFVRELKKYSDKSIVLHDALYQKLYEQEFSLPKSESIESIDNPAKYVGLKSEEVSLSLELLPLYARDGGISR